jgi:biotin carboxyl carrier protein
VAGCTTNLAFLSALLAQEEVREGRLDTGLIGRDLARLTRPAAPPVEVMATAALGAADVAEHPLAGFHLWSPLSRRVSLRLAAESIEADVKVLSATEAEVSVGVGKLCASRQGSAWRIAGALPLDVHVEPARLTIFAGEAGTHAFGRPDPLDREEATMSADLALAPMPGLVRGVAVASGQRVARGERLAVLEAMKMEHTIGAPRDGLVAEVLVQEGAQVEAGAPLVRLEPPADAADRSPRWLSSWRSWRSAPATGLPERGAANPDQPEGCAGGCVVRCGVPPHRGGELREPRWVPQMADGAEVMAAIRRAPRTRYMALAPNLKGYEAARAASAQEVAVFVAATEGFARANLNCTVAESLQRVTPVAGAAAPTAFLCAATSRS